MPTLRALGSGDVPVLGTPRLIALVEEASVPGLAGQVPEGHTTVGMRVQFDHVRPNKVGVTVTAEATLEKVEGRRLTFSVSVNDERGLVAPARSPRGRGARPVSRQHGSPRFRVGWWVGGSSRACRRRAGSGHGGVGSSRVRTPPA